MAGGGGGGVGWGGCVPEPPLESESVSEHLGKQCEQSQKYKQLFHGQLHITLFANRESVC